VPGVNTLDGCPSPAPSPPWPTILILHEGHFAAGSIYSGQLHDIAKELQCLGYFVLIGDHRLAPCGLIEGQTVHDNTPEGKLSGRPIQQKNDIKSLIKAARADNRFGKLGVLGGSSGATHAAWVAIDQTVSTDWPIWNKHLRPDAVACLSGAYDFSDRSMPGQIQDAFVGKIENYTDTCVRSAQRELSIVRKIELSPTDIKPIFAFNCDEESIPVSQIGDLRCALQNRGVSASLYQTLIIPGNHHHAFQYWHDWDGVMPVGDAPTLSIATHVINFFDTYLKH